MQPLEDRVDRPGAGTTFAALGALTALASLALSGSAYAAWTGVICPLPSQGVMLGLLGALAVVHACEAWWVHRTARRIGLEESAAAWFRQTMLLGVPSTLLMARRARQFFGPLPPGHQGLVELYPMEQMRDYAAEFMAALQKKFGDVAMFRMLGHPWVLVNDPEAIYDILTRRADKFHKAAVNPKIFRSFLGYGILSADGEAWRRNHKMMMPAFHKKRIQEYATVMTEYTSDMLDSWTAGEKRDVCADMNTLTLAIVGKTLFDADVRGADAETVGRAMLTINHVLVEHVQMPIPFPRWWPSRKNRRKVKAVDAIDAIVRRTIRERQASGEDRGDLLSMMLLSRDEDGLGMNETQLRDEAMTIFFAGHETTAHTLTWAWYLLAKHPEVSATVQAELDRVLQGRTAGIDDLKQLPYLEQVVKEAMRLIPAVYVFMREPVEDVVVGGYTLKKGWYILISPYVLHRNERFGDPLAFRPERWTKEMEKGLHKGAYVPFSAGARVCLGKVFAIMELKLILATMLQRVTPRIPEGHEPVMLQQLSLNPKDGLPAIVDLRTDLRSMPTSA
jgi:cytochrome P450